MRTAPFSALLLLALATLFAGCATTQTRILGDDSEQRLAYSAQGPELAKNSWAEVTLATTGFAGEADEQFDIPFWWEFALQLKIANLKAVSIYDVTTAPPRLLLADPAATPQDSNWQGRSEAVKFSKDTAPWFFLPGEAEHIFKIVLTNSRDEERILYQPCRHSEAAKKAQILEIVRLTAPESKLKRRRAASVPRQNPPAFNVFLPKRPPAPEHSYSVSGDKNGQALAITISPKGE